MQRKVLGPFAAAIAAAALLGDSVLQDSQTAAKPPIIVKPSKLTVIAKAAGGTELTIADSQGHTVKVPIGVTTAVVVIH